MTFRHVLIFLNLALKFSASDYRIPFPDEYAIGDNVEQCDDLFSHEIARVVPRFNFMVVGRVEHSTENRLGVNRLFDCVSRKQEVRIRIDKNSQWQVPDSQKYLRGRFVLPIKNAHSRPAFFLAVDPR